MIIEEKEEKMKYGNLHDVFGKLPFIFCMEFVPQQQCPRTIEKNDDNFEQ